MAAAAVAGAVAAATAISRSRGDRYGFDGKVVLITGGSRGLGLIMARQLVAEGAKVAIFARDADELRRAGTDLKERGGEVIEYAGDVRNKDDCAGVVRWCLEQFGGIDVLINAAGVIQAGPLESQTEQDFKDAIDTHFWGPYNMTAASLDVLKRTPDARIINIASIGGKIAVPHLAPYCASKFALVGLSSAWRLELAKEDITVTTVCPGLMRTGSHINALFKGQKEKEYALFSISDAFPLSSISAERAVAYILAASRRGDAEAIISIQAKVAAILHAGFPELSAVLLTGVNQLLPESDGSTDIARGLDVGSSLAPSFLTANIDEASELNNELKPGETIQ